MKKFHLLNPFFFYVSTKRAAWRERWRMNKKTTPSRSVIVNGWEMIVRDRADSERVKCWLL